MNIWPQLAAITIIIAPAALMACRTLTHKERARPKAVAAQAVLLYGLGAVLAAAEPRYWLLTIFTVLFAGLNALNVAHYLIYRAPISASAFGEILLCAGSEWREYVTAQRPAHVLLVSSYFASALAAALSLHALPPFDGRFAAGGAVALALVVGATAIRGSAFSFYPLRYAAEIGAAVREMVLLRRRLRKGARRPLVLYSAPAPARGKVVVLIGESVRRDHLSIYGYGRDTTPALAAAAPELVVFEDAVSPASQTRPSLEMALTPATLADSGGGVPWTSIVGAAGDAGYATHWISNQPRLGLYETEVSVMAMEADRHIFLNTGLKGHSPDRRMLPHVRAALAAPGPGAIFVHMMGSHPRYENRLEDGFHVYTHDTSYSNHPRFKPVITDNYDNTIRYLDAFLREVMEACTASAEPCLLVFFSDHGHVLFDDGESLFHGLARPLRKEFEVPYLYWPSPRFRDAHPDSPILRLPPRVEGRAHLENLFDDLALVMGLAFENYETRRSNIAGLRPGQADRRQVLGRTTVYDFAELP